MMNGNVLLEHKPQEKSKKDEGFIIPNNDKFEQLVVVDGEGFDEGEIALVPKQNIKNSEITVDNKKYIVVHAGVIVARM